MDKLLDCRNADGVLVDEVPEGADPDNFARVWISDDLDD